MSLALLLDGLDHLGDDDVQVAHDSVMRHLEDGRILVGVDRNDLRRVLHSGEMLHRAGDAAADEERGTNRNARLSDLALMLAVAKVDGCAASADRAAKSIGEIVK